VRSGNRTPWRSSRRTEDACGRAREGHPQELSPILQLSEQRRGTAHSRPRQQSSRPKNCRPDCTFSPMRGAMD
jgi:hypothetical protein